MGAYGCNAESITAGIIAIVEEIQTTRQPSESIIVLNSILPRAGGNNKHPNINVFDSKEDRQWPTIRRINQWLQCYADSTEGVQFFNATDLFLDGSGDGLQEYFDDSIHPSPKGHKHWAEAISTKVAEISR